uniref:Ninja-family protein n=1 Tax=Anthurium amnicola TaxID=1678845 RepID=A0A1D1YZ54_9ARAE
MAEAGESGAGIRRYPRDLLRQFSGGVARPEELGGVASATTGEDSGEIELSLGLSLGGCFGVDPTQKMGLLHRSSSIASIPFPLKGEQQPSDVPSLKRTCSLPVEAEEEQRKRKELQCLRLMEGKRMKSENRSTYHTVARGWAGPPPGVCYVGGEDMQQDGQGDSGREGKPEFEQMRGWPKLSQFGTAAVAPPNGVTAAASQGWGTRAAGREVSGMRCFAPMSQGSVGSQGSNSSGLSDFDSRPPKQEELVDGTESRRQTSIQSLPKLTERSSSTYPMPPTVGKPASCAGTEEVGVGHPSKKVAGGRGNGMKDMMEAMPCVSTKGDGPNGRRVEGFLYRYRKGEEVRIVCVCHGRFLSPAEFVKHGGGGDVAHPLRHIIVNPSPLGFL